MVTMSVSSQGQLVGSEISGQTHCSGFLSNVLCMWSELKFVVVQGILVDEEVLHSGLFCLFVLLCSVLHFQPCLFMVFHQIHRSAYHKESYKSVKRKEKSHTFLNIGLCRESDSLTLSLKQVSGFSEILTFFCVVISHICQENQQYLPRHGVGWNTRWNEESL